MKISKIILLIIFVILFSAFLKQYNVEAKVEQLNMEESKNVSLNLQETIEYKKLHLSDFYKLSRGMTMTEVISIIGETSIPSTYFGLSVKVYNAIDENDNSFIKVELFFNGIVSYEDNTYDAMLQNIIVSKQILQYPNNVNYQVELSDEMKIEEVLYLSDFYKLSKGMSKAEVELIIGTAIGGGSYSSFVLEFTYYKAIDEKDNLFIRVDLTFESLASTENSSTNDYTLVDVYASKDILQYYCKVISFEDWDCGFLFLY